MTKTLSCGALSVVQYGSIHLQISQNFQEKICGGGVEFL